MNYQKFKIATKLTVFIIGLSLFQSSYAFCIKDNEMCVEGAETRLINGYSIHKDCWRYASQYTCDGTTATPDTHCQDLIDAGCSPLTQTCDLDSCIQTYECNVGSATTQTGVGCDAQSMAINGLQFDSGYQASTDFAVAASNLAALESAVTGMISNDLSCAEDPPGSDNYICADPISIFQGKSLECRKDSFGFNQCCNLSGWGTDAGLSSCNAQEHELGYARQAAQTHYIGSYCSKSNTFGCFGHSYTYCSFTSKIGRIIQEHGRVQLGIGWGSPQLPDCRGFTEAELASLDFELIDFSEFFSDAFADMENPPTSAEMEIIVNSFINKLQQADCSQFDEGCIGSF